jgi:YggT family protein
MFVIGNFIIAVAQALNIALTIYLWIVVIRAFISWVSPDPYNPVVQFLYKATDPVLGPIARALPPMGGMDLSPIVLILIIYFLQWFVVKTLIQVGLTLHGSPI